MCESYDHLLNPRNEKSKSLIENVYIFDLILSVHFFVDKFNLPLPIFSEEDIQLVSQQAGVDAEKAKNALEESKGDLARAILLLTTG